MNYMENEVKKSNDAGISTILRNENMLFNNNDSISFTRIFRIAFPSFISMFSLHIMQFVDRTFVAWYDLKQFSAIMPSGIYALTVCSLFFGITGYTSALVAQYYGAGKYRICSRVMWQAVYLGIVFSIVLILCSPLLAMVFKAFGHSPDIVIYEKKYFHLIIGSSCFQIIFNAFAGFFNGRGDTRTPMIVGIVTNGLNIVLDWILVFGKFGLPAMGIVGAGIATIMSSIIALCIIVSVVIFRKRTRNTFGIFENLKPDFQILRKIVRYGFPAGAHFFLGVSSFSIFLLMVGRLGEVTLAAANIAFSIEGISFMPVLGFAIAIGIISGQEKGGGRPDNVSEAVKKGIMLVLVYNVMIITVFNLFPESLVSIFSSGKEVDSFANIISITVPLIHLTSLWLIFDSIQLILSETLKSLGDTFFLMIVSGIFPFLFFLTPSYLAAFVWKMPLYSLWIIIVLWVIILFLVILWRFLQGKWKEIDVI